MNHPSVNPGISAMTRPVFMTRPSPVLYPYCNKINIKQ